MPPAVQPLPPAAVAARLRAQAAELLALADAIEAGDREISTSPPDTRSAVELAADYITAHPGSYGQAVANAAGVDFGHFRSRIVPRLKARGFTNAKGDGYRPPRRNDVQPM